MLATYRILTGKDRVDPRTIFDLAGEAPGLRTREAGGVHNIRRQAVRPSLDIRRYTFSQRVVNTWNQLLNSLRAVNTVLAFKIGYDEWVSGGRLGA